MKRLVVTVLVIFCFMTAAMGEGVTVLSPEEAKAQMGALDYLNLFDVRHREAYDDAHIPGAINFPLDTMKGQVQQILDAGFSYMDAVIFVYGDSFEDAEKAACDLMDLGFKNIFSLGAARDWPDEMISAADEERMARQILSDFETADTFGTAADEHLLQGYRLTMVNIWATYCNPCLNELPDLARLSQDMKGKGVQIIGIVSDAVSENKISLAQDIAKATGAEYMHLLPCDQLYQKLLSQVASVPTTVFVDETGTMIGSAYIGSRNYEAWKKILDETLLLLPEAQNE